MNETWKPVAFAEGYEVSDFGRVRSWRVWGGVIGSKFRSGGGSGRAASPRFLSLKTDRDGYKVATLMVGGKPKYCGVHRLVAMAFVGPQPEGKGEVRHLDGDPKNNTPANLAWGDRQDNALDKVAHGRSIKGMRHRHAKLTDERVRLAVSMRMSGATQMSIATRLGVSQTAVNSVLSGRTWTHVTGITKSVVSLPGGES